MSLFAEPEGSTDRDRPRRSRSWRVGRILVIVAVVCAVVLALTPAPFVIMKPGPVFNTLGTNVAVGSKAKDAEKLIRIEGHRTYPTKGSLDMLTVSSWGRPGDLPSWFQVVSSWFSASDAVLPVDAVYPPGLTVKESNARSKQQMSDSQQNAVAAALTRADVPFAREIRVESVEKGSPADGVFRTGDRIVSVDGTDVHGIASLRAAVAAAGAGHEARVGIVRAGEKSVLTLEPERENGSVVLGVGVRMHYEFPFTVHISLRDVGGPSAGMMFTLGILDKLTPGSLTGGKRFAGTGTIDDEGDVGPIGDIRQKMHGARAAGARWFLAPVSNCDEVVGHVPAGLHVVAVKNLDQAVHAVETVASGAGASGLPGCHG